ncbi:MAG: hypothetical protein JW908_05630 [Anaerolineales bacterium]|nr:hypothetical protein [Anaerolineales bacterium]
MRERERPLSEYELSRPAMVLAKRFVQRWDIYARQLDDGRYICVHEPLNVEHLFAHLRGEITLGTYCLNQKNKARFMVFDADDEKGFQNLIQLNSQLAKISYPSYLESSRRGGHLWFFFEKPISGREARLFGQGILDEYGMEGIELFPKQDRLSQGPGSLIRMPFGLHRITGMRYGFITPERKPLAPTIREQIYALSTPQTISELMIKSYPTSSSLETPVTFPERSGEPTEMVSQRIKQSITVLEFVSQYVDLKPNGSGAIGKCPFHDDQHPSFSVNDKENYWHCFAGCGGGSIIDFWMKWRGIGFVEAVHELDKLE